MNRFEVILSARVACSQAALWELLMLIHCEAPLFFSEERMCPATHTHTLYCLEIQRPGNVVAATACDAAVCVSVRGLSFSRGL